MVTFTATLLQFEQQGEKTGWTYIDIPVDLAEKLKPGNKKSFRVKGRLDNHPIKAVALIPIGGGKFIMAVNAGMRKGIGKRKGAKVNVQLEADNKEIPLSAEMLECLADEPKANTYFKTLPRGHQQYFSNWIESAKTEPTKIKRIALAVSALSKGWGFSEMIRAEKARKEDSGQ